jgi:hypothetical protein
MIAGFYARAFNTVPARIAVSIVTVKRHCDSHRSFPFAYAVRAGEEISMMQAIIS